MTRGAVGQRPPGIMPLTLRYHVRHVLHTAPPAYLPQEDSARCVPREHPASLCTKRTRFDIIAVLYTCTTVAHAPPPTRAPHIYVYSPSPVVSWSRLKSSRLFGEEVLLPYGLATIAFRYLTPVSQFPFWY